MIKRAEKVIIITEKIISASIIEFLESLGIKAYTIYHSVSGQGERGMRSISGGLSRFGENIRIEVIIENEELAVEIADKIYHKYLHSKYAGIIYLEGIRILSSEE